MAKNAVLVGKSVGANRTRDVWIDIELLIRTRLLIQANSGALPA